MAIQSFKFATLTSYHTSHRTRYRTLAMASLAATAALNELLPNGRVDVTVERGDPVVCVGAGE